MLGLKEVRCHYCRHLFYVSHHWKCPYKNYNQKKVFNEGFNAGIKGVPEPKTATQLNSPVFYMGWEKGNWQLELEADLPKYSYNM